MATAPRPRASRPQKAKKPRYEPVLELPPLPPEQYEALRDNIAVHGVLVAILVDGNGPVRRVIDGNHRKRIADELGYECPEVVKDDLTEQEKRTLARALNLARRQLDQASKRAIIADQLRETPGRSNRWVGKQLGVDDKTVAAVRVALLATAEIPQFDRTLGADNKSRPASPANCHAGVHQSNGHARETDDPTSLADRDASSILADFDEEAILQAAAEIRRRRVADQLREAQERRRRAATTPLKRREGSPVLHGNCLDLIPTLEDGSVGLVVTSPPYAEQRAGHYGGVPEADYPEFTVRWMDALRPKLKGDGSVLIVIRPHLRDGVLSDYVLRTRLALREAGWKECEELIWVKPTSPPLGSKMRPRRAWESVLWFSEAAQPYCDLTACGRESDRLGFDGSIKFAGDGISEKTGWHPCVESFGIASGIARVTDVFVAPIGGNEPGVDHPAMFPIDLADQLIRTFSQEGELVLDPFCGSGQTLLAAKGCGRRFLGMDREAKFVRISLERLGR
jgi:site-specific DNA-methyltransferase (adenine-specific)/site-specific DNA-methyltransferase (cytosine-N4-specific)